LTIAHPLVLLLFQDTVHSVIEKDRQAEIAMVRTHFSDEKGAAEQKIGSVEQSVTDLQNRWNETFQAKFIAQAEIEESPLPGLTPAQQAELKKAIDVATAPTRERLATVDQQIGELTPVYTKIQEELSYWQTEFEREVNGQRSGIVGLGPRAKSIQDDQLAWRRQEAIRLGTLLEHATGEKTALQSQAREAEAGAIAAFQQKQDVLQEKRQEEANRVAALRRQVEAGQAEQFVSQQNDLRDVIKKQIDTRLEDLKVAQAALAQLHKDEKTQITGIQSEPRRDILKQTLALHRLFEAGDDGGRFALTTYLVLTLLFLLVDTIPLMVKFFCKAGPYDMLLDRDEVRFDAEHSVFINSHSRYMEQLGEGNLVAVTANRRLEAALVDGVEHTRAAREFLSSLIEMEKAFQEKMALESADQHATSEKLNALELMKKHFYGDLHRRMERFFSHGDTAVS